MDGRGKATKLTKVQGKPAENAIIFYRNPPHSSDG
jgi:iduronate 2-sulfatase